MSVVLRTVHNDTQEVIITQVGNSSIVGSEEEYGKNFFILIFGGMVLLSYCLALLRGIVLRMLYLKSSNALHNRMLHAVLRTPILFFNSHPSGRLCFCCVVDTMC